MTSTKLTALEKTTAVSLLSEMTAKEVAKLYNVSTSTVCRWKKEFSNDSAPKVSAEPETTEEVSAEPETTEEVSAEPETTEEVSATEPQSKFNHGTALRSLALRINFLKGTDFLSNADIKKIYNGNNPVKILADAYQQEGDISIELATKVASYFLDSENESIISMVQNLLNDAYSCRTKSIYEVDCDGKRRKESDKDGKTHLIPTGIKDITYIGLCQYKKTVINGLLSIYCNNKIERDSNRIKREKTNLSHNNRCEGIVSKRGGKKVK